MKIQLLPKLYKENQPMIQVHFSNEMPTIYEKYNEITTNNDNDYIDNDGNNNNSIKQHSNCHAKRKTFNFCADFTIGRFQIA